mmetsp:Transcript_40424/g.104592  ORF Transcript_40424/g.104592 Transcript_40424/m.104592 type:complete len:231 (-) Transcript_40424:240-932(-)
MILPLGRRHADCHFRREPKVGTSTCEASSEAAVPSARRRQRWAEPSAAVARRRSCVAATATTWASSGRNTEPASRQCEPSSSTWSSSNDTRLPVATITRKPEPVFTSIAVAGAAPNEEGSDGTESCEQVAFCAPEPTSGQLAILPEVVTTSSFEAPQLKPRTMPSSTSPSSEKAAEGPAAWPATGTKAPMPKKVSAATVSSGPQVTWSGSNKLGHCTGTGTTARVSTAGT